MSPDAHAIRAGWVEVLDGLEADLTADRDLIERTVVLGEPTAWEPPQHLGPIPTDLRERAGRILGELGESSRQLTVLKAETGQQLAAVRSVPSPRSGQSVYLDITG